MQPRKIKCRLAAKKPDLKIDYTHAFTECGKVGSLHGISIGPILGDDLKYHQRLSGWVENCLDPKSRSEDVFKFAELYYKRNKIPLLIDGQYFGSIFQAVVDMVPITCMSTYLLNVIFEETEENMRIRNMLDRAIAIKIPFKGTVVSFGSRILVNLNHPFDTRR